MKNFPFSLLILSALALNCCDSRLAAPPPYAHNPKLTLENLKRIHNGMLKSQVNSIIGEPGMMLSNGHGVVPDDPHNATYVYQTDEVLGADITFSDDKMTSIYTYNPEKLLKK